MRKTKALSVLLAAVMCLSGCGAKTETTTAKPETQQTEVAVTTEKAENGAEAGTAEATTEATTTPVSETTTEGVASIASLDSYDFNLDEAYDTTMDNNMSDNVKVSLKLTTLNDATFETAQDAQVNGYNENNSNTAYIPFDGYITYRDFCNIKGCELEPWHNITGYTDDGKPKYSKEGLSIGNISVDKDQNIYTEKGKEFGNRKFLYTTIGMDSITKDKIETDNKFIIPSVPAISLECVNGGEVIDDESATIPDDAIVKGVLIQNSYYAKATVSITLDDGNTVEIDPANICDAATAKKYFRELGLITTDDADEIYRYEMRANDQARLLVFKNNNIVIVIGFTWNGGNYQYISVIKR